jgi:hypothetical protein
MTFVAHGGSVARLPSERRPYARTTVVSLVPRPPVDAAGIRLYSHLGKLYYHPALMAQQGLLLVESWRIGGGAAYLTMAKRYADKLITNGLRARDSLYLPYLFRFTFALAKHDHDLMRPPWYSALAQGQALSLMVRLFELTGEAHYRHAADAIFSSFLRPRPASPWTVFVDSDRHLWLEEYPKDPPMQVLNGHIFAIFGLYDYYLLTGSPDALSLIEGAAVTVLHYFPRFRVPGGISLYSIRLRQESSKYHAVHVMQLRLLAAITGDAVFSRFADLLAQDHGGPPSGGPASPHEQRPLREEPTVTSSNQSESFAFLADPEVSEVDTRLDQSSTPCGTPRGS